MLDLQENLPASDSSSPEVANTSVSFLQNEQPAPNGEKYIVFYLNNMLFAVLANQVAEVFPLSAVTPLPKTPEWLSGIANARGEIVCVADLNVLSGGKKTPPTEKSKLIVLRSRNTDDLISVTADKLSETVILSSEAVQSVEKDDFPRIFGKAVYKSKELRLINAEGFFQFTI